MPSPLVLAADIGGSHITAALIDMHTFRMAGEIPVRKLVNSRGSVQVILDAWCSALREARDFAGNAVKLAIAMPGPFDYDAGISYMKGNDKYEALYGSNVKQLLSERLQIPENDISFKNDAACFLQGEMMAGALRHFKTAIGLCLGTGLGSARRDHYDCQDAERWCAPFREGIAEDYLSTRWFIKRYHELTGKMVGGVRELSDRYDTEPAVQNIFEEFAENLSLFLADFMRSEKPGAVVIGGNIAKASKLFLPHVRQKLSSSLTSIPILPAELGEHASIIGAAGCWRKSIQSSSVL